MVSDMNVESRPEICDNRSMVAQSAISHSSIDFQIIQPPPTSKMECDDFSKKILKLDLNQREEKGSFDSDEKTTTAEDLSGIKSPKSPLSNSSRFSIYFPLCRLLGR